MRRDSVAAGQLSGMEGVFAAGGEAGQLMRSIDWPRTALGPLDSWPQSLRSAVSICLLSRFPMVVWWGPDLVFIPNEAYRPLLGVKDPASVMGQVGRNVWPEIWNVIGPMLHGVLTDGSSTLSEDQLLLLDRNGYLEECYFTYSFSPIHDETGGIGGIFTAVIENTQRVIGARRLRTLSDMAEKLSGSHTADDVCMRAAEAMVHNPADIPFALLYLINEDGSEARLAGSAGSLEPALTEPTISLDRGSSGRWPLPEVAASGQVQQVSDLPRRPRDPGGHAEDLPDRALVLPIAQGAQTAPTGMLVVGVSPRRALDADYHRFFELIAGQVGSAIADARAYEAERKRAEALAELDRAKTAFFGNVSHEFRTPLTLLLGPLEQALTRLPPDQRDDIEIAHRNAMRLLRLVNTLLDFSRIEAGRIEASYTPVDFSEFNAELASAFRSALESAGLRLVVDCPPLDEQAYVDVEMWEKVVLNLVSNAFKFTLHGQITVRSRMADGRFELMVSDTGAGIAEHDLSHLFDRFYRVHEAQSRTHEGTGIGLALVRELVILHGGEIRVESTVGVGTTFTVSIPKGADHLPADHVGARRDAISTAVGAAPFVEEARRWLPGDGSTHTEPTWSQEGALDHNISAGATTGARVLVVDDNADMRDYLVALLSPYWTVEAVPDGRAAVESAAAARPDLVLTDVMMPGIDGFELLRALRSKDATKHIPVVMLSARAGEEATVEGLDAGADDYLVKPFVARELVARVRANLELSRMRLVTQQTLARFDDAERALQRALESLAAVAQHIRAGVDLPTLLGRLSETVAELASSRRVLFWRLEGSEVLGAAEAYGIEPELLAKMRVKVSPVGEDIADRIVFRGEIFNAPFDDSDVFAPYREVLEALQTRDAIGVPWRAGDQPLGLLVVYDSLKPGGFTREDVWVVRIAALAAALVWEHKQAEDQLALINQHEAVRLQSEVDRTAQLEKTKSEFLRLASHELRGPLTVLAGYLALIKNGTLGEMSPALVPVIPILETKLREMKMLVDQMLEAARLEDHKLVLSMERLDLRELVKSAVQTMAPLTPSTHVLKLTLPQRPVWVDGDAARLTTVMSNLIDNAVRYSPDGGTVEVTCTLQVRTKRAAVEVCDEGLGIANEDLPRLFTRFGRIVTPENSHISGTGLGLYLSRELTQMHRGTITVSSTVGKGSKFEVTLPMAQAPAGPNGHRAIRPREMLAGQSARADEEGGPLV